MCLIFLGKWCMNANHFVSCLHQEILCVLMKAVIKLSEAELEKLTRTSKQTVDAVRSSYDADLKILQKKLKADQVSADCTLYKSKIS
jgi:hypothetical protein